MSNTKIKDAMKCLLFVLVLILAFECVSRIAKTIVDDFKASPQPEEGPWFVYSADLGWKLRPNFSGSVFLTKRQFDAQGFVSLDTEQVADRTRPKILVFGDSNVFGNKLAGESTFVEVLDRLLPDIDVINMGVPGYTSFQGYSRLLKEGLNLNPSLIIVSFNYNDRRYVLNKEDMDSDDRFKAMRKDATRSGLEQVVKRIHLTHSLRFAMQKSGILKTDASASPRPDSVDIRTMYARVPPEQYRQNLTRIADVSNEKKIPMIFLLLKDNPANTEHLTKGIELLNNSEYQEAIREFRICRGQMIHSVIARRYLYEAYEKLGFPEKAEESLFLKDIWLGAHGGFPVYPDFLYNEIMIAVARERNIELVDAGSLLNQDPGVYIDGVHFYPEGHAKVGHLIFDSIKEMGLILNMTVNQKTNGGLTSD